MRLTDNMAALAVSMGKTSDSSGPTIVNVAGVMISLHVSLSILDQNRRLPKQQQSVHQ
jgi:hypothetical protein